MKKDPKHNEHIKYGVLNVLEKKMPNTNTVNTPNTKKGDSVTE